MKNELTQALVDLRSARGNRNRVAVLSGHGYLVFSTTGPDSSICIQATANRRLPKGIKLTPEQAGYIGELGLRQARASDDFQRFIPRDDTVALDDIVERAPSTLIKAYGGQEPEMTVQSRFESVPVLDGHSLSHAMNHLAKNRTWAARKGLYMTLVKATLVCPTNTEAQVGQLDPYVADQIASFPVVAAFANYEALDLYNPIGLPARVMSGVDLFPELFARKVGSVLLNPHGQPRGELYSNELGIIVDGIKRLTGQH